MTANLSPSLRGYDVSLSPFILLVVAALKGGRDVVQQISMEPPLSEAALAFLGPFPYIKGRGPVAL